MSNKLARLNLKFKNSYKKCMGYNDDRQLFINMIDNLKEAIVEFESLSIESPIIKCGFIKQYKERVIEIEELEKSLKNRNMINK